MNRPEMYRKVNFVQRNDAEYIMKQFSTTMQWRYDGHDSLIDVGSGSGDVLMDFIHPMMPSNFQRLVCSDINPKIVSYAKSHYDNVKKCEFKVLDIGSSSDLDNDIKEQFDHVTCFYTLMWVKNQRQGLRNIYQLLRREGGDCLLVFLTKHPVYDGYMRLSKMPRWSKYMKDVDDFMAPLQYSRHPAKEYSDYMTEAGLTNLNVVVEDRVATYNSVDDFKDSMTAVNPFIERIPQETQADYMSDLISTTVKIMGFNPDSFVHKAEFSVPYKLFIGYARKAAIDVIYSS